MFYYYILCIAMLISSTTLAMSNKKSKKQQHPIAQPLISGTVGGFLEAITGRPLGNIMLEKISGKKRSLYQGFGSHVGSVVPSVCTQITLNNVLKKLIENDIYSSTLAGALSTIIVTPTQNIIISQKNGEKFTATIKTMQKKGWPSFLKGWKPTSKQEAIFTFGYLKGKNMSDEFVKKHITTHPIGQNIASMVICGVPLSLLSQPFTNIATWQQYNPECTSYKKTIYKISKEKVLFSKLYKGSIPRAIRYPIALFILNETNKFVEKKM
jgi:hypothetical protein